MKTKTNTLIEDGQDIKVDRVKTDIIDASDYNKALLSYDGNNGRLKVGSYDNSKTEIYANEDIGFLSEAYGNFSLDDTGLVFFVPIGIYLTNTPFHFSTYSTASRPTGVNEGAVIYDETLKKCILYNGTAWVNLDGTALS